ncbi:MAG TPA: TRAP transporter large permease [Paenibacillaceae bacterium]
MTAVLLVLMFVLLFLSVPIAFAMAAATIVSVYVFSDFPIEVVTQKMFTALDSFPLLAIPLFVLAGKLMETGGISRRLINLASAFVGHTAGGYAAVGVVTCLFFGTMTGSSAATVAAIGSILIPAMISRGYSPRFSAGAIAVPGELSSIIPPSIPMILYGVTTGTSIGTIFIAGVIPGIILGLMLLATVFVISKRHGYGGDVEKANWREKLKAIKESAAAMFMPVIILGGIYAGVFTPTEAAAVAVLYALIIGKFVYKELKIRSLIGFFAEAAITTASIMIIIAAAGLLSWYLTLNMIPQQAAEFLTEISGNHIVYLLLVNLLLLIVGMFFEASSAILVLAPILTPVAIQFGIDPVHFGIIMIVNLAMGMVTPPVGVNLFVSCQIANISLEEVTKGVLPFYIVLLFNILLISYWPALSMWLPSLM